MQFGSFMVWTCRTGLLKVLSAGSLMAADI